MGRMVSTLLKRGAMTGVAVIGLEAAYAILRPSPELTSFDPSAEFGDPAHPTLRVAVLGDSSVTAPGVSGPEDIWVTVICRRLADTRHVILKSFAVGGSMAHDVRAEQMEDAIRFEPDLILLSVGANDVIKGVPRTRFASNLDRLVAGLSATGATVVSSGVGVMGSVPRLFPPLSTLMSRRAERFDRVHWEVAAIHGTHVVDQRSDDPRVWFRDRTLWAEDLFHVSAAGHARWAETAWRTIGPLYDGDRESG